MFPFLRLIPLAIALGGLSLPARAGDGDTLTPYVFAAMTHDSNLLRIDSAATGATAADTLRQAGAGLDMDWKVSRQQLLLTAAVNQNRFERFSTLNYTGRDLRGIWNWRAEDNLSGDLGYTNNRAIGSFADQQSLVSNLRVQERGFFDGAWSFHPSWQVGAGISRYRLTYPSFFQRVSNREDDVWETSLRYLSGAGNRMGVKLRETSGRYPNQGLDFARLFDDGYRQREMLATLDWANGGRSRFQGQAGTVQRTHNHFASRDYRDVNARGTYTWLATGHTELVASAWREIWAYDDLATSYSRNRGIGLEPKWLPSSRLTLSIRAVHEQRDFLGDPGIVLSAPARRDVLAARDIALTYQPARAFSVKVSAGVERRDSSLPLLSYYSRTVNLSANLML